MRAWFALVAFAAAACASPIIGHRTARLSRPVPPGPPIATALAADPAGIRVLANDNAGSGRQGLLATTPDEYAALWHDVGLGGSPPAIDFTTHVVLGSNFDDGVCHPELVAANIDAAGVLTFEEVFISEMCILLASRTTRVIAVPRTLLPAHFTWRTDHGDFAFDLAPRASIATHPSLVIDTGTRTTIARSRGTIELPAIGHIALRALDDGREIWVAHRDADDISVILADHPSRTPGLHFAVHWSDKAHRFTTSHDSRGRSINGGPSLDVLAFTRVDGDHISIGDPIAVTYAPPIARASEPALDGSEKPYTSPPVSSLRAIADHHIGVYADSLVIGLDGQARLCTLPEGKARQFLPGCHRAHPALTTFPIVRNHRGITMIHGPIAIRRTGEGADLAINLGHGESGWTVERTFQKPAERGPARRRGPLVVGHTATASTSGYTQFNAPPECVPIAARGSPDDQWTFEVPHSATYLFELEAKYDATLALVDKDGNVIACNDDAKGFHRRSLINIELAANTNISVMVDGFGGDRGDYRLTIHEQPTLQRLAVGGSVTGDTTNAIDQESHGCSADGGDHRYPLTIQDAGLYAFRIDTPGWPPMISVFPAKGSEFGCYTHMPPLVDVHRLEPGEYFVVIDGISKKEQGRYTLSVERCATDDAEACRAQRTIRQRSRSVQPVRSRRR